MISRVQRTSGNVGRTVAVMPNMLVDRLTANAGQRSMVMLLGGSAGQKIGGDPWQGAERREDERDQHN